MSRDVTLEVWEPREFAPLVPKASRSRHDTARFVIAALVVAAHAYLFSVHSTVSTRGASAVRTEVSPLLVELFERESTPIAFAAANVPPVLHPVSVDLPVPREISLEVEPESRPSTSDESRRIVPFSPPRLDPNATQVDSSSYAEQAGLGPGRSATTVLALDISDNGAVAKVLIEKSSGDSRIDAAAVEYARALRWFPAIVNGERRAMRVRFPATLTRGM